MSLNCSFDSECFLSVSSTTTTTTTTTTKSSCLRNCSSSFSSYSSEKCESEPNCFWDFLADYDDDQQQENANKKVNKCHVKCSIQSATSATSTSICSGGSTTLTATGATSYTWQPGALSGSSITVSPTTTTTYTVTGTNSSNGCTATAIRTITVSACPTNLTVKAYLDGYYLGGGLMQPVLTNQGQTPSVANQCDNVTIELRNPNPPYALVSTAIRPILTNGTITSGYFNILGQSFYIVIKHRNGLETWSANPVVMTAALTYDFTTAAGQAYGGNQKQVAPGIWAMYNSDINQDDAVDALDYLLLDVDIQNGASGYLNTDVNGDGSVDALDYLVMESDILNGITASTP